jgi:hypothetical protein
MLVYMFRHNGDHALTTDMTGRNLPSRTPSRHWMYVETLDTNKFEPRRDIAEIHDVLSRVKAFGYYILCSGRVTGSALLQFSDFPLQNGNVLARTNARWPDRG